jgi:hypothetical protein
VNIPHVAMLVGTISGQQALWDYATRRPKISDRVFEISRHGKALDTKWDWNHEGPDANPDPTDLLADLASKYPFELPLEWVERNAAQSRYDFWFKLTPDAPGDGEAAETSSDEEGEQPVSDAREALMNRVKGIGQRKG